VFLFYEKELLDNLKEAGWTIYDFFKKSVVRAMAVEKGQRIQQNIKYFVKQVS
jgi:hypothetical protein